MRHSQDCAPSDQPPEVVPEQRFAGCGFKAFRWLLTLFGLYAGWQAGVPYLVPLAKSWELPLDEIDIEQVIPLWGKSIHIDGEFLCCAAGAVIGMLAARVISAIAEAALKANKFQPRPEPEPKPEPETENRRPEIDLDHLPLDSLPVIEKEALLLDQGYKDGLRPIRHFLLSLMGRKEGFEARIHCPETFLLQELRRDTAPPSPMAFLKRKDAANRSIVHEVILTPVTKTKADGTVYWWIAKDNILAWKMTIRPEKKELVVSFYPARRTGGCLLCAICAAVPLLLGAPGLWIVFGVALCVALGILLDRQRYACAAFTQRLRDIEKAYAGQSRETENF